MRKSSGRKGTLCFSFVLVFVFWIGMVEVCSQEGRQKKLKKKRAVAERIAPDDVRPVSFIDGHVHLNDLAMQLELMEANEIPRAVVFWGRNSTNESLVESSRKYPEKLIPFVSVSPERRKYRALWNDDDPKLLEFLEVRLKTGFYKGIGEISVVHFPGIGFPEANYNPMSSTMRGIMKLADRYKIPITIHCEITRLREFSDLLKEFESVNVIWAHGGYTPYFLAKRMLENHSNLYYELSARTWLSHPRSPDYTIFKSDRELWHSWLNLIEEKPDRFIVGTDASHHSRERENEKIKSVWLLLSQLSKETQKKVAEENLLRLIGN